MVPLTSPSITAAAPEQPSPRDARTLTLLLVGRIIGPRGDGLCRIRNISTGGLMAEVCASFEVADAVRIELRNGQSVHGEIRWIKPGMIGLRFDGPIADLKEFLAEQRSAQRKPGSPVTRSLRLPADCSADIQLDGHHYHAAVTDLSQNGARLVTAAPLERDRLLTVAVAGLPNLRAVVRWLGDDGAGVAFLDPLAFATLAEWMNDPTLRYNRRQGA